MDVILAFPALVLAIALVGAIGLEPLQLFTVFGMQINITNQLKVVAVVAVVYIPRLARVMRSSVMKEMEEEYVDAARTAGGSTYYILVKEIFPNALSPVIVQATLYMGYAVLAVAGLSFLGIGIQPPRSSLGMMLSQSRQYMSTGAWWFTVVPGFLIVVTILSFNIVGDGLRDSFDPKHQQGSNRDK
jgi:ABC-type dipeptide/oligopeptide/nickel transport system permease subunit